MEPYKLHDAEYKLMGLIWDHEPLSSGKLVSLCAAALGWKKSTVYTVLRKLCDRGVTRNQGGTVTALLKKADAQQYESQLIMEKAFNDSLPAFVAAFLQNRRLGAEEADELRKMIEEATK